MCGGEMTEVEKVIEDGILKVSIKGVIDESFDFENSLGKLETESEIDCYSVSRITSIGIKNWVLFFQTQIEAGAKIKLLRCSPPIVEQINDISNFAAGFEVISYCLPYYCQACDTDITQVVETASVFSSEQIEESISCSKCGKDAEFDEIPSSYFVFLSSGS